MRVALVAAAALLVAVPVSAQSGKDVTGPRTLKPWMVGCADLPVTSPPTYKSTIKGVYDAGEGRILASTGTEVMIGRTPDDGLAPGQRYIIRRAQTTFYGFGGKPATEFGRVRTAGSIIITAVDEHNARATVDFSCDPIAAGDYLEPYFEAALPDGASSMIEPDFDERFSILEGTEGAAMFGDGDILSVDRGQIHNMAVGQRIAFYRDYYNGRKGMPLFYLGDGVVMFVNEKTSKVVVVKALNGVTTADVAVIRRPK